MALGHRISAGACPPGLGLASGIWGSLPGIRLSAGAGVTGGAGATRSRGGGVVNAGS